MLDKPNYFLTQDGIELCRICNKLGYDCGGSDVIKGCPYYYKKSSKHLLTDPIYPNIKKAFKKNVVDKVVKKMVERADYNEEMAKIKERGKLARKSYDNFKRAI